jgi:hypothetical protein
MVRSFTEFAPIARYDGHPWYTARIQEAEAAVGPWTTIDTIDLAANGNGLDPDPAHPAVRSLTTENATDAPGLWYRIVFVDGTGDEEQPTDPVTIPADLPYRPSVVKVASWLRERTYVNSTQQGTFTASTNPTGDQVEEVIDTALLLPGGVYSLVGSAPAAALERVAREAAALKAAMLVELSYFGSQVNAGRSPYKELSDLYKDAIVELKALKLSLGADGEPGTTDDEGIAEPSYSFGMEGGCHVPGAESPWPEYPSWFGLGGRPY